MAEVGDDRPLVSIVTPVLNEADCIPELVRRVVEAAAKSDVRYEILLVDDGSTDATAERIAEARARDAAVKTIRFTRSFGHQAALSAGLEHAIGDAVITMDGDLQHPPECIPRLVEQWRKGADVVHTVRRLPPGHRRTWFEQASRLFYPLMNLASSTAVVPASSDFRLLDRRVVDAFKQLNERFIFIRGLVPWLGYREAQVEYTVAERFAGERKYNTAQMSRLALDGIFSFSVVPLRLISLLGLVTTLAGLAYGVFSVVAWALGYVPDPGWPSLVVLILVFGGVQLLSLGIVSEYVGRIYEETKGRPRYVIDSTSGVERR